MGRGDPGRSRGRGLPVLVVGALLTILLPVLKGSLPASAAPNSHPIAGHGRRVHHHEYVGRAAASVIRAQPATPSSAAPLGGSWTSLGPQPIAATSDDPAASGRIAALAVDPSNSAVVYAGAAGGGVWKSSDGGVHWAPKSDAQLSLAIGALAIDPNSPAVIYAGTGEGNGCADCLPSQGVLKSIDGGGSWVLLGATTFTADTFFFEGLTVDRANSHHLLAATNRGLYQSADGGTTWARDATLTGGVNVVVQDPTTPAKFWAATADWCKAEAGGIAVSTDAGASWTSLTLPSLPRASRLALGVGANGVAYASVAA